MPIYTAFRKEVYFQAVQVEANSVEEAHEKIVQDEDCTIIPDDFEYSHTIGVTVPRLLKEVTFP